MSETERALESFSEACRSRGLSVTHQRLAIYEALVESRTHPSAEEIYRTVKEKLPTVSRGTVYRTLETLCAMGLVTDVSHVRGLARFEAALEPHHHLVCLSCRTIIDLRDDSLKDLAAGTEAAGARGGEGQGFEITGYQIQFYGYCRKCRHQRSNHT